MHPAHACQSCNRSGHESSSLFGFFGELPGHKPACMPPTMGLLSYRTRILFLPKQPQDKDDHALLMRCERIRHCFDIQNRQEPKIAGELRLCDSGLCKRMVLDKGAEHAVNVGKYLNHWPRAVHLPPHGSSQRKHSPHRKAFRRDQLTEHTLWWKSDSSLAASQAKKHSLSCTRASL